MFINDEIAEVRLMDLSLSFLEAFWLVHNRFTYQSSHDTVLNWMGH